MSASMTSRLSAALQELKSATRARHLLRKETPEYRAALDRELRLVTEVRDLAERDRNEALTESD
jgi:transcription elongation GreA/GreB family factor